MSDYDWEHERGEQWLVRLSELEAMLKPIERGLVDLLAPQIDAAQQSDALRIADVACGGGATTFAIETTLSDNSTLHGFDISSALVNAANQTARTHGSRAVFSQVNLEIARPPSQPYDFLVSRFGVMFFLNPARAFANLHKWLKPQGKFAFAIWGDPAQNPWMTLLRDVCRQFVDLPSPEPDTPGPFRYANTELLLKHLSESGFTQVTIDDWRGRLPLGGGLNATKAADFALNAFTFGDVLRETSETVYNQARAALIDELKHHETDGEVLMSAFVHIVSGSG